MVKLKIFEVDRGKNKNSNFYALIWNLQKFRRYFYIMISVSTFFILGKTPVSVLKISQNH